MICRMDTSSIVPITIAGQFKKGFARPSIWQKPQQLIVGFPLAGDPNRQRGLTLNIGDIGQILRLSPNFSKKNRISHQKRTNVQKKSMVLHHAYVVNRKGLTLVKSVPSTCMVLINDIYDSPYPFHKPKHSRVK